LDFGFAGSLTSELILKRASVPSVPKKLSHNGLDACESVLEIVLAGVSKNGLRDHRARGPGAEPLTV
jgi:hypothetical protein